MKITINEWIIHYIYDEDKYKEVAEFLVKVLSKCDKLVLRRNIPLAKKILVLSKDSGNLRPQQRYIAKFFIGSFIHNSEKCEILYEEEISRPPDNLVQFVKSDDLYLIENALATDKFILTTDSKLKQAINERHGIKVELVNEFFKRYDC